MKSTATSTRGQNTPEPARSRAGNPPRSNSQAGYLGELAAAINAGPGVLAQRKLAREIQESARMGDLQQFASEINHGIPAEQAAVAQQKLQKDEFPAQREKYPTAIAVGKAMDSSVLFAHLSASQKKSVAKEFPDWYAKKYRVSLRAKDFATLEDLKDAIDEMITEVDALTDREGQALTDRINSTQEDRLLIGYRARGENRPGAVAARPFGDSATMDSQIGQGLYVAQDIAVAQEYANQYVLQGMISVVEAVYLNVNMIRSILLLKGISVTEWWKEYNPANDDAWDIVVSSISGKRGQVQYKVNPKHKESGLFVMEEVERQG